MVKQQRSAETREKLLESGAKVFASTPYDKSRIADVIEPIGVTQGAFYFHFDSKHDLALEIIKLEHELMIALSEKVMSTSPDGLAGLRATGLELARLIKRNLTVKAGLRLTSHVPEEFPEYLGRSFDIWEVTVSQFLVHGQQEGTIRTDLDIGSTAKYIIATFVGLQEMSGIETKWRDLPDRIRTQGLLTLRAVAAPDAYAELEARERVAQRVK